MSKIKNASSGYPRLGEKREWKFALEHFWSGKIDEQTLLQKTKDIRLNSLKKQKELGIDYIATGDFSLYDHVLDTSVIFNVIPKRFRDIKNDLEKYFAIARGNKNFVASELTKWFNTNYHYIVPEIDDIEPKLADNKPLFYYKEAKGELGIDGKPVILGPITFLRLSKGYKEADFDNLLEKFIPLYRELLDSLEQEGAKWVQIDEPYLVTDNAKLDIDRYKKVYKELKKSLKVTKLQLNTYFGSVDNYKEILELDVDGIGLDFVNDNGENLENIKKYGFSKDKVLFAGIINARNIWASNLEERLNFVKELLNFVSEDRLILSPSNSLLHVPVTKKHETRLDKQILDTFSFADEKLQELVYITNAINSFDSSIQEVFKNRNTVLESIKNSPARNNQKVKQELENLEGKNISRSEEFEVRNKLQKERFKLPLLPTTTIGSFPQSEKVRKNRKDFQKGVIDKKTYDDFINSEIARWIKIQEEIGIDVLVHGEFERNDMVEYFGEKLTGFDTTEYGWVQSYGSRAVKPPVIYGDVDFTEPITVKESVYAQSLTKKPVKGMITAPLTIANWSFLRDDVEKFTVLKQIGLALRKELKALEDAGIAIIQVDEPALKEGLPLKQRFWDKYLKEAVYSFHLTTGGLKPETQCHTHMCYSEFQDIISTIEALDADVISIEASRSGSDILQAFKKLSYNKNIGLGVYDIHSPRIPSLEEVLSNIRKSLEVIDINQFWINPDCGLKTRKESETVESLKIIVEATKILREEYKAK